MQALNALDMLDERLHPVNRQQQKQLAPVGDAAVATDPNAPDPGFGLASQQTLELLHEIVQTHRGALLQASSRIAGRLPAGYPARIGELLFRLLPAGSVSGAPKRRTVEIIRAIEGEPRGYYTGVFGYFDGRRLDSAVMIRYIERQADGFYYRSGGGITAMSREEEEYRELIHKIYVPIAGNHTSEERAAAASAVSSAPF